MHWPMKNILERVSDVLWKIFPLLQWMNLLQIDILQLLIILLMSNVKVLNFSSFSNSQSFNNILLFKVRFKLYQRIWRIRRNIIFWKILNFYRNQLRKRKSFIKKMTNNNIKSYLHKNKSNKNKTNKWIIMHKRRF